MKLAHARLLSNLPSEWEDKDFQFLECGRSLIVFHQEMAPVEIRPDGTITPIIFNVRSENEDPLATMNERRD